MKASNGMGTIFKLKGKRRKPYIVRGPAVLTEKGYFQPLLGSFETKKEAEIFRIAYFNQNKDLIDKEVEKPLIEENKKNKKEKILFEDLYDIWLKNKKPSKLTLRNLTTHFNNSKKLHKLDIKTINGIILQNILNEANLSKGTLRNLKSFWKQIFDFAILNDFCQKDYVAFLKLPSEEKGKKTSDRNRIFTTEDLQKLWNNLYNDEKDRFKIIDVILVHCYTGLRPNELLNIKIENVNLKEKYIDITKSKTKSGIRRLPIPSKIFELIKKRYDKEKEFLFTRYDGSKLLYDTYDYQFREVMNDLEIDYHTTHDCRHTFATLLSNAEIDKEIIIRLTGHSSYKITSEKYIHKVLEDYRNAIDKI